MLEELKNSSFGSIFQEMYKARISIFISIGCSILWSMLYIQLMSLFAEAITWISIFLIQIGLVAATFYSFILWEDSKK